DATVEFTDGGPTGRTVILPMRAALPVLAKARSADDAHPSVSLLAAASLLGMRFVAAGKFEPGGGVWRPAGLDRDDADRLRRLARARAYDGLPGGGAEGVVLGVVEGGVAAMPRSSPVAAPRPARPGEPFARRLQALVTRHSGERSDLPQLVTLSLRVEADEEELVGGAC